MGRKNRPATGPPEGTRGEFVAVKFDRVLADKLKLIVRRRGGTMSKHLSDFCRVHIEKEYAKVVREMAEELGNA